VGTTGESAYTLAGDEEQQLFLGSAAGGERKALVMAGTTHCESQIAATSKKLLNWD